MTAHWQRIARREGVDITTLSEVDRRFYELIWEFSKNREELFFTCLEGKAWTHYLKVDFQELGRWVYEKHFRSPLDVQRYYRNGKEFLRSTRRRAAGWERRLKKPDLLLLRSAFRSFRKDFRIANDFYSITSFIALEAWQADFTEHLTRVLNRAGLQDREGEITAMVCEPWKRTAVHELRKRLRAGEDPRRLAKRYQFLRSWAVVWYRPIDEGWVKTFAQSGTEERKRRLTNTALQKMLKPNAAERRFLALAPYIAFFKDWRDDLRREHAFRWCFLFQRIAEYFGIPTQDIGYLTIEELEQALQDGALPPAHIQRRKQYPCIITAAVPELRIVVQEYPLPQRYTHIMQMLEQGGAEEIRGLPAQSGTVRGRVIIMNTYHDIKKVSLGDILVAHTTHPNYLPAMRLAAAFITNEGGIMSHAAIVAREMKKPCIVGTKVATSLLRDGDSVEVDATLGRVTILKRA